VLEDAGARLGVVTEISGCLQGDLELTGTADHAGATPMGLRHDALAVAAEIVLDAERLARDAGEGTVATVGVLEIDHAQRTAVPGRLRMELDAPSRASAHENLVAELLRRAASNGRRRGVATRWRERHRRPARTLDPGLRTRIAHACERTGGWLELSSGAIHDTLLVAERIPSALLFVPCEGGRSHTPDERADARDAALAVQVLLAVAQELIATPGR
jgi:acetylornithine deacetylase/succinyl-diaminopimelate desuccinylase-like protein